MKILTPFLLLIIHFGFLSAQPAPGVQQAVEQYKQAFIQRDFAQIQGLLAGKFSIAVYQRPMTDNLLKGILEKYYALDSLQLHKVENQEENIRVQVKYFFQEQKPFISSILLNKEYQLLYADLFDNLYRLSRYEENKLLIEFPFKMVDGHIMFEIQLNDSPEKLIMLFDTGADGMALSQEAADRVGVEISGNKEASVVGGTSEVALSKGNTLRIDTLSLPNQNLVVFPQVRGGYDGLFGGNFLRNFVTQVDFDQQMIRLYNFGSYRYEGDGSALPVDYSTGNPEVLTHLVFKNGREIPAKLTFDTGAGYNAILFGPFVEENALLQGFEVDYSSTNYSFGLATKISMGDLARFQLGSYGFDYLSTALQSNGEGGKRWTESDGSMGIEVIRKFNFTFNLAEQVVFMEPNTAFDQPFDVTLKGAIMGVEGEELKIKGLVQGSKAATAGLRRGDVVVKINDYSGEELILPENHIILKKQQAQELVIFVSRGESVIRADLSP
ncbi:aspartyl protease family protein [Rapidithrix thailandica]|uniref:Aspartyl protease family protein n=1 Tax=Rapidithrix thailandica TaxID=413964 RepID=A0AAW9S8K8_9BACT